MTSRRLGTFSAAALVVANMIGFGVFTTSGFALADLGSPARVLWAWVVGGGLAILGALCYGALARRLAESGGEYLFLTRTVHPAVGFVAGWISLLAGFTAPIAGMAAALEAYSPWAGDGRPFLGSLVIVACGLLHGVRLRGGVVVQNVAVVVKLMIMALLIGVGGPQIELVEPGERPEFSWGAFAVTVMWVSLSYSGWNAAVYISGEVRDAERRVPRALLLGTGVVIAFYLLLNALFVYAGPLEQLAGRPDIAAAAAEAIGSDVLATLVRGVVCVAMVTSISSMVMAGPRVYARMAEDGVFPRLFAAKGGVPGTSIALQVVLSLVALWVADLVELLDYISWTLSVSTAVTVIGLMRLRVREGRIAVPIPGWPVVPLLFAGLTLGIALQTIRVRDHDPLWGGLTIASGLAIYWLRRFSRDSGEA